MTAPVAPATAGSSTRPYLIRALHDWCTDNGFTPYIAVFVDDTVRVPREYVKNNEIVLNVGFEATSALKLGNEAIEFKARFGGASRDISVPVDHVIAIYARENGQGMAFPMPASGAAEGPGAGPVGATVVAEKAMPALLPAPAHGPRLARSDGAAPARRSAPAATLASASPPPTDGPPDPPPPKRPSLKRVK